MQHKYHLKKDQFDTHKSRILNTDTQETAMTDSIASKLPIPSQTGNLAMQRSLEKPTTDRWSLNSEDMIDATSLGHGGEQPQEKATPAQPQKGGGSKQRGANPGGRGPGRMRNARETPYDVVGPTLTSLRGQLGKSGGYAAETNTTIGLTGRVSPQQQPDGTYRVQVQWSITGATTTLPRWTDYDNARTAAQTEWDRYLLQLRAHEQAAHVDTALNFVKNLQPTDTVITGASVEELQRNLKIKQQELADRLQATHDACTHGYDIDAVLNTDKDADK